LALLLGTERDRAHPAIPPPGGLFYFRSMFKALPSAVLSIGSLNDLTCPHADTDRVKTDWPN
jgi:hypothetical protein